MESAVVVEHGTMAREACRLEEERMVQEDRWREIHRMARVEQLPIAEIALFRGLFRGRADVFPRLWANSRTGKRGYAPARAIEWA